MQAIFEKIIEKMEEYKYLYLVERDSEISQHCKDVVDCEGMDCSLCVFDKAIEIVKQVAAEYDGGWIPCSERMPENISTVIVQVKEIEKPTFGWYGNKTGWRLAEKDFVELKDFTVIAWQPLPEPYLRMESEKCETAGY